MLQVAAPSVGAVYYATEGYLIIHCWVGLQIALAVAFSRPSTCSISVYSFVLFIEFGVWFKAVPSACTHAMAGEREVL